MARCSLDLTHPKFRIIGAAAEADVQAGLNELRTKLARDHRLSHFVPHPMKKYLAYQNRIWKWDFAPHGDASSTRKGWRLYAYVPDPKAPEPIPAVAFLCYDKSETPTGDHVKYLAGVLKEFLGQTIREEVRDERFRRQTDVDGKIISVCLTCFEAIFSEDYDEAEIAESTHECLGSPA